MINIDALQARMNATVRDVPDFPKPGILFKDITPLFLDAALCNDMAEATYEHYKGKIDAVCAIESRGFFLGMLIAQKFGVPLFPVRKKGKLPAEVRAYSYDLEYGSATLEIHRHVVQPNWRILIHDDILATGGTAVAAAELVQQEGGLIQGFSFLAELGFLNGQPKLLPYAEDIFSLITYP